MNVKKFYEEIGGNYEDALSRLMNDELVSKFVLKFKEHDYLTDLEDSISSGDLEKVFFAVHTLKGVALNLSFEKLGEACVELTEYLRGDKKLNANMAEVVSVFKKISVEYKKVIENLNQFIEN